MLQTALHRAEAWIIPPNGQDNTEEVPDWVVHAILDGTIEPDRLGGIALHKGRWSQTGIPGDVLILYSNGDFEIIDPEDLQRYFEPAN